MRTASIIAIVAGIAALPAALAFLDAATPAPMAHTAPAADLAHVRNEFEFTVHAPYANTAPLFGADAERVWAGSTWNPRFVHPAAAPFDVPGAVFELEHQGHHATWVCTAFDLKSGHVQYVYMISGALATLIDIHITAVDAVSTRVAVAYERTALTPEANDHVRQLGESDRGSGKEWQEAIDRYLATRK